ncbi:MAG: hypothetical protein INR73_20005 [Williamsia sp.]|nr:hypothetical protein [Williamsia sp.]
MLHSFSWSDYIVFVLGLTLLYYSIVLLLYYKKEVKNLLNARFTEHPSYGRNNGQVVNQIIPQMSKESDEHINIPESESAVLEEDDLLKGLWLSEPENKESSYAESDNSMLFPLVHDLINEIGQVLKTAAHKHYLKQELITALQITVSKYPMLDDTAFRISINNFLATESRKLCSVFLSDDELERLWKKGR